MFDLALILALLALLLSGIVQGSSGFGFSLVSVGLLGMILNDSSAGAIIPVFANLVLTIYMFYRYRAHVEYKLVIPFLTCSLTGVPIGVWVLSQINDRWINFGLAIVLIFSGIYALLPKEHRQDWHPVWLGAPCGFLSGWLAGAFNTGGPPAVAYLSNRSLGRFEYVATLQFVFLLAGIIRVGCLVGGGMITQRILTIGLLGIITGMIGCVIGTSILSKLTDQHLRSYVCAFQIVLGVVYLWRTFA